MASGEVTGGTWQDIAELKFKYERSRKYEATGIPFEVSYCLTRIGKQPEEYDGPDRFCKRRAVKGGKACPFHGGTKSGTVENLDKHANLKHSMYALPETIYETLTDDERALYEWVFSWPEVYGIDFEGDPASEHSFETLALEIVRQARSSDYILANTEVTTEGVYTPGGELLERKDVPNRLIKEHQSQVRMIEKIKDSLGISRKSQATQETAASANNLMDSISGVLSSMMDNTEYDPSLFDDEDESAASDQPATDSE
jgi:hypothetical protein